MDAVSLINTFRHTVTGRNLDSDTYSDTDGLPYRLAHRYSFPDPLTHSDSYCNFDTDAVRYTDSSHKNLNTFRHTVTIGYYPHCDRNAGNNTHTALRDYRRVHRNAVSFLQTR
jgi:hypothetical protein